MSLNAAAFVPTNNIALPFQFMAASIGATPILGTKALFPLDLTSKTKATAAGSTESGPPNPAFAVNPFEKMNLTAKTFIPVNISSKNSTQQI